MISPKQSTWIIVLTAISSMSCETSKIVIPCCSAGGGCSSSGSTSSGPSPDEGSSRHNNLGLPIAARASSTSRCWPAGKSPRYLIANRIQPKLRAGLVRKSGGFGKLCSHLAKVEENS